MSVTSSSGASSSVVSPQRPQKAVKKAESTLTCLEAVDWADRGGVGRFGVMWLTLWADPGLSGWRGGLFWGSTARVMHWKGILCIII